MNLFTEIVIHVVSCSLLCVVMHKFMYKGHKHIPEKIDHKKLAIELRKIQIHEEAITKHMNKVNDFTKKVTNSYGYQPTWSSWEVTTKPAKKE